MDKKSKKRIEILRQKIEKTQKLLAAALAQTDDPQEVKELEQRLADYHAEIADIKQK